MVASTHRASGFENFFIGSNAFKIITATYKPVFTIGEGEAPDSISKIILPIDISADTRQKVPFTAELAKWFGAKIIVVTVTSLQTNDITKNFLPFLIRFVNTLKNRSSV